MWWLYFLRNLKGRSLPSKGDSDYISLRDFTNAELIGYLNDNENVDLTKMTGILSEILRRMNLNQKNPLLPMDKNESPS